MYTIINVHIHRPDMVIGQSAHSQTLAPFLNTLGQTFTRKNPGENPLSRACDIGLGTPSPPATIGRCEPVSVRRCGPYVTDLLYTIRGVTGTRKVGQVRTGTGTRNPPEVEDTRGCC